jgi:chromosomal replication initiation ATPase DnaA
MIGVYTDVLKMPIVVKIIADAEMDILIKTGVEVKLAGQFGNVERTEDYKKTLLRKLVCEAYECTWEGILSESRIKEKKDARHAYIYLLFTEFKGQSKNAIGRELGKDHGTIINALNRIKGFYEVGDSFIDKLELIKKQLANEHI